jgi:hypothetical protein
MVEPLVGAWRLVRITGKRSNGSVVYPFGEHAQGSLIYTASGRFSAHVMRPDRPRLASGNRASASVAELEANFLGYVAYYGSYDLHADDGYVIHNVEGSLFPNWEGQPQKRFFEKSGRRLLLKSPPLSSLDGTEILYEVLWERVE